jgi:hemolysin III
LFRSVAITTGDVVKRAITIGLLKDPISWATHFAGFVAAIVGLVFLVVFSAHSTPKVTAMAIYGSSLVVLFGASAAYHFFDLGTRGNRWLKRIDHAAIFFLIAGTYVPAAIHLLEGAWRISILAVVGGIAVAGILFKIVWIDCPAWLGVVLYLTLGWVVVVPAHLIFPQLDAWGFSCLVGGGLAYTAGAVIFLLKRPDPWPQVFGYHEIWHLFVLVGAGAHFAFVWWLVDRTVPAF